MVSALVSLAVYALISFIIKDKGFDLEILSLIFVVINSIILMIALSLKTKNFEYYLLLISGYLFRLMAMFWDIYARAIYILPHSGSDTEGFYSQGLTIAGDLSQFNKTHMGAYANFLGFVFRIFGDQRILAQYINVLLGMCIIILTYKILILLDVNKNTQKIIMLLIVFFPQAIIFSAILLRENLVSLGLIFVVYYFIRWYKNGNIADMIFSYVWLLIATYFHSGVFAAFLPLALVYSFYDHKSNILKPSKKSFLLLVFFSIMTVALYLALGNILLSKFGGNIDLTSDKSYQVISFSNPEVGSRYLTWIQYNNIFDIIIYSPLKVFYFLFSPIPLDWRNVMDVITFAMDSLVYLILCIFIIRNMKYMGERKIMILTLAAIFIIIAITFAYGTIAAGTAVRHRNKIYCILLIIFAVVANNRDQARVREKRIKTIDTM